MYRNFYNLHCKPFENTPDPDFLFLTAQHRETLSSMLYGVEEAKGFILITGSVGTGKTTLVRSFLRRTGENHIVINITNPKTSFDEVLSQIRNRLSLEARFDNRLKEIERVQEKLVTLNNQGNRVILLIDEAHLLSDKSLEEIRLLSNIEHEKIKLIQIILVAQNEIYPLLEAKKHASLHQRIVINRQLVPLNRQETAEYIRHRLKVAGGDEGLFHKQTIGLIWQKSQGSPRVINHLCDNALLIGFATEAATIGKKIIKEVVQDMGEKKAPSQRLRWRLPQGRRSALAMAAAFMVVVSAFLLSRKSPPIAAAATGGASGHRPTNRQDQ